PPNTTATVTITPKEGEDWACTFTNTQLSGITIIKSALGGDATFGYTTTGGLSPATFNIITSGGTGSQPFLNLPSGSYSVTESAPPTGWQFTSLTCTVSGAGTSATPSGQTVSITLGPSGNATCTY